METHVRKWGNSLGVRIPMHLAKKLHIHPGTLVVLEVENSSLVVRPPQYDSDSMLDAITRGNKHHILLDGDNTGSEEK